MDKVKCCDCGCGFVFSEGLLSVFSGLNFFPEKKRCTECWKLFIGELRNFPTKDKSAICDGCGKKFITYFKVVESSSLLCKRCFSEKSDDSEDC